MAHFLTIVTDVWNVAMHVLKTIWEVVINTTT